MKGGNRKARKATGWVKKEKLKIKAYFYISHTGITDEMPDFAAESLNSLEFEGRAGTWYGCRHGKSNTEGAVKPLHRESLAISPASEGKNLQLLFLR